MYFLFSMSSRGNKNKEDVMQIESDNSSAGRAEDCRVARLSFGRWFNSSLSEFLIFIIYDLLTNKVTLGPLNIVILIKQIFYPKILNTHTIDYIIILVNLILVIIYQPHLSKCPVNQGVFLNIQLLSRFFPVSYSTCLKIAGIHPFTYR